MDFSLFFFSDSADGTDAGHDKYGLLLASAEYADANGFAAVWTPERHFHSFGGKYPNPAVVGAALATVTDRLAIRAGSVVAPLHHPVRIAEEWSVVDNLSGGRAGISFASGWHSGDFVLRPAGHENRKQVMLETIDQVRRLWRGEAVDFDGVGGVRQAVRIQPAPIQAELPVWVTAAGSPATFQAAGALGAGVLTHQQGQGRAELAYNIAGYRRALAAAYGEQARGHVTLMLHTLLGEDPDEIRDVVRAPLTDYLRGSVDLIARDAANADLARLSPADREFLLERGFGRYFETAGLFGTVADAARTVRDLAAIGVDEIACLVDFGVPRQRVLAGLEFLGELCRAEAGPQAYGKEPVEVAG